MQYENEQGLRIEPDGQGGWRKVSDSFERSLAPTASESFGAGVAGMLSAPARTIQNMTGNASQNNQDSQQYDQFYGQNPWSYGGGQAVGAIPGIAGGAGLTRGLGVGADVAMQAFVGSTQNPENPLLGAGLGAAGAAAVPAAGAAWNAAKGAGRGLEGISIPGMGQGSYAIPGAQAGRPVSMAERVMGAVAREDPNMVGPPAQRVLAGTHTAQELDAMGVQLLDSQRIKLGATNTEQMARGARQRWFEEINNPGAIQDVLNSQRRGFTDIVKSELGMEGAPIFTRTTVSDQLAQQGKLIGDFRKAGGPLDLGTEGMAKIKEVADQALSASSGDFNKILKDIETAISQGGGSIEAKNANTIMTKLNKMSAPGGEFATTSGAKDMLAVFNDALAAKRTPAEIAAYKDAMYKYKILKALDKGAAIGSDSYINPSSFGKNWDRVTGQTLRGKDVLGKAVDTFDALASKDGGHAGTTLQRGFAQLPKTIKQNAPGLAVGALAIPPAVGAATNWLLGN